MSQQYLKTQFLLLNRKHTTTLSQDWMVVFVWGIDHPALYRSHKTHKHSVWKKWCFWIL